MEKAERGFKIKNVILITHIPILEEQFVYFKGDNYFSRAYFYNFTLGKEIKKFSKVFAVISGHTHRDVNKDFKDMKIKVIGSDYYNPKFLVLDL